MLDREWEEDKMLKCLRGREGRRMRERYTVLFERKR